MPTVHPETTTYTIDEFCKMADIRKTDFANRCGVQKQQLTNWEKAKNKVEVIYNPETKTAELTRLPVLVKEIDCSDVDSVTL